MKLFNPFKKISCPFCNHKFHPSECAIYSTTTPGKLLYEPTQHSIQGKPLEDWFLVNPLGGSVYAKEMAARQCPECKKLLPYRYEFTTNLNIAIIGNTSSGKSHYIAALLDQLISGGMMQQGEGNVHFIAQTEETEEMFEKYRMTLFEDQNQLPGTLPLYDPSPGDPMVIEPFIFQLIIRDMRDGQQVRNLNLIIYDVAGEDIANKKKLARLVWPILEAHAIIYFADPLSMPNVVDQLAARLQLSAGDLALRKRKSHDVLHKVIPIFKRYRKLTPEKRVDVPVAIMLSKSDLLEHIRESKQQKYTFMQNVNYDGRLNLRDVDTVNTEVMELLTNLGEQGLLQERFDFSVVHFFATSATGCSPDANGNFEKVEPRRCLDPLLWILWRLGEVIAYDGK